MKGKMQKFTNVKKKKAVNQRKRDLKKIQEKRKKKRITDDDEIQDLSSKLWHSSDDKEDISSSLKTFADFPISKKTLEGLTSHNYVTPTDIQRESLLYGLKGHDILGAAKTGSGKTLAFLIPILETLFRQRYTPSFGMAALVIAPTRELAYQSFEVLKKIGKLHDLSFALVTGGMHLKEEAKRMNTTNVVICTPGRLQQHFEQTPNFTADELKVLVLDEADKILHMGFAEAMNAIVEALPKQRQTLLFSATQTKSVKDLAKLSLKRPIYVSVHEKAKEVTPTTLDQRYVVCEMHEKVNVLWSFIRSHRKRKMLVFLSCCKQVRYLYQVFKKMHPGVTILALHGHMKQHQRMESYANFGRKQSVVLLATDVAARGLDFPVVNWVVQVDKPENVDTYIHRVGRTARYDKIGEALLMLLPAEEQKMSEELSKRKIPIAKLRVSKKRMFDVTKKLESLCAADKELKDNARKGFISVMKTLYVLDKAAFQTVDKDVFAASLGLVHTPKLPFLSKKTSQDAESDEEGSSANEDAPSSSNVVNKGPKTLNFGVSDDEEEEDESIYNVVKDSTRDLVEGGNDELLDLAEEGRWTSRKKATLRQKLKLLKQSKRIEFDDEGNPEQDESDNEQGLDIAKAKLRLKEQDKVDKEVQRQRVKAEHRDKRLKEKDKRRQAERAKRGQTEEEEAEVILGPEEDGESNDDKDTHEHTENGDGDDGDSDDDGPVTKRRKIDFTQDGNDEEDEDESEEDDGDDDMESANEASNDSDEDEESEIDDKSQPTLETDEAAVLALLGGT